MAKDQRDEVISKEEKNVEKYKICFDFVLIILILFVCVCAFFIFGSFR